MHFTLKTSCEFNLVCPIMSHCGACLMIFDANAYLFPHRESIIDLLSYCKFNIISHHNFLNQRQ